MAHGDSDDKVHLSGEGLSADRQERAAVEAANENASLRDRLQASTRLPHRHIWSRARSVALADVASGTAVPNLAALAGRSVLLLTQDMLAAALALIELDGLAADATVRVVVLARGDPLELTPAGTGRGGVSLLGVSPARIFRCHDGHSICEGCCRSFYSSAMDSSGMGTQVGRFLAS